MFNALSFAVPFMGRINDRIKPSAVIVEQCVDFISDGMETTLKTNLNRLLYDDNRSLHF